MKHLLFAIVVSVAMVGCVDTDETLADETEVEEVMRQTASDDPADVDVEIGMSEFQQSASVSTQCASCVAACCGPSCFNNPDYRYSCAQQCWTWGFCTRAEYYSFRPRFQTP